MDSVLSAPRQCFVLLDRMRCAILGALRLVVGQHRSVILMNGLEWQVQEVDLVARTSEGGGDGSRRGHGGAMAKGGKGGGKGAKKKAEKDRVLSSQARDWMRENDYELDDAGGDNNEAPPDWEGGGRMEDEEQEDADCGVDVVMEMEMERWFKTSRWPAFQCVPSPIYQIGHSRRSALMVSCMLGRQPHPLPANPPGLASE